MISFASEMADVDFEELGKAMISIIDAAERGSDDPRWAAGTKLLMHKAARFLKSKISKTFTDITKHLEAIATTDKTRHANKSNISSARSEWRKKKQYREEHVNIGDDVLPISPDAFVNSINDKDEMDGPLEMTLCGLDLQRKIAECDMWHGILNVRARAHDEPAEISMLRRQGEEVDIIVVSLPAMKEVALLQRTCASVARVTGQVNNGGDLEE